MTMPMHPRGETVKTLLDPDGDVLEPGKHQVRLRITGDTWFTFASYDNPLFARVVDPDGVEFTVGVTEVVEVRELDGPYRR